jgi:hypothetical protein
MLDDYTEALRSAPLSAQTRRTYASKVRQYLAWLAGADLDEDPFTSADDRDWAVRDYRTHLQTVLKRSPATVNNALAAIDDLYIRRGLGPASAARIEIPAAAPQALDARAQLRYLRAVQACASPRDQALALARSTPARESARSSRSTSTTSPAPPAKATYESSAKANASATSQSTHNYTPR